MVVALHSSFKAVALVIYIGASFITNSFIACFIMVMMLLSADFWIVKNISGQSCNEDSLKIWGEGSVKDLF